jgi:hypothetical protein
MRDDPSDSPKETQPNTTEAADPQAIMQTTRPKLPLSDNDPTRNVTPRERLVCLGVIVIAVAVLVVLVVATMLVFTDRS